MLILILVYHNLTKLHQPNFQQPRQNWEDIILGSLGSTQLYHTAVVVEVGWQLGVRGTS